MRFVVTIYLSPAGCGQLLTGTSSYLEWFIHSRAERIAELDEPPPSPNKPVVGLILNTFEVEVDPDGIDPKKLRFTALEGVEQDIRSLQAEYSEKLRPYEQAKQKLLALTMNEELGNDR